jgi:hypothetical protein
MPLPIHNQKGTEIDVKAFNKGASYSIDEQFLGQSDSGMYIDAENMRPTGLNADEMALSRISGEEIEYISEDNSCNSYYGATFINGAWRCMATIFVKGKIVELWCDETPDVPPGTRLAPFIRIDGIIYAASPQLPIDIDYPIQFHWNNTCLGGEIYITDNNTPPIILNVQDMIDSSDPVCTEKYFTEFDRRRYEVNTQIPPHMMAFVELTPSPAYPADKVIGSAGLKVGMYSYSFRYVTVSGDRTAWTNVTPTIPVPVQINVNSSQYPSIKTFGADPNTQSGYGIVLNFRIQNELGYDYIEIKRYSYNTGVPVGFTPSAELIGTLGLVDGENVVKYIVDFGAVGEPITDEDDTVQYGPIEACKTLRYFENRLHLMNVRYASMDFTPTFVTNGRPNLFPVMAPLGTIGYNDAYYTTYYRSLFRGEKYGFGVGFWNSLMGQSFATPVTGFTNYQLPDRRDTASGVTQTYSYTTLPRASVYQTNSDDFCHETYSLINAVTKNDCCSFKNIACDGQKQDGILTCDGSEGITNMPAFCGCVSVANPTQAVDIGYQPLTPTSERDPSVTGHDYVINTRVQNDCSTLADFHPAGFAPEYFALGVALNGIDDSLLPSYIQAFSILRTKPAGRVVFQGIGGYYLYPNPGAVTDPAYKALDKLWFYSFEASSRAGLISQQVINEIGTNSGSRYEAQLVSPVGIFPEVPHGENRTGLQEDHIDMCLYPRFYQDNTTINLVPDPTSTGGYVQFGKWRNAGFPPWVGGLAGNRASFVLNEFRSANNSGTDTSGIGNEYLGDRGNQFFVLGTSTAVYNVGSVGLGACDNKYSSADLKSFHEPWYNVNIIDTLANVPATDVTTYFDTGAYQKLRSWIGTYASGSTTFTLAGDERWEDVRPWTPNNIPTGTVAEVDANTINSIVQIEKPDGTVEFYLNVDGVGGAAVTALSALLPFTIGAGATSKPNVTISGLYGTTLATTPYPRIYSIVFGSGSIPVTGSKVIIKYDNEVPVKAFGGDVYTGDDTACFVDRQVPNGGGNPAGTGTSSPLPLNLGLPYYEIQVNPRMFITQDAKGGGNKIQDCSSLQSRWLRQMIALFNCESRIHLPYNYEAPITDPPSYQMGKFFPATNYIMRPNEWETTVENDNFCGGAGIVYDNYKSDYPDEWIYWRYGGYRYQPQFNIDYMHIQNVTFWTTKPTTGFRELTEFCTRDAYSLKREIARVDSPGIRTFLAQNVYDLDDQTGEIKFAWSALGGNKGNNLYAFTERGMCLLLTEDAIIRDATGEQIAMGLVTEGKVIGGEYWISREIGMNEESWRSRAEYNNSLYFMNRTSAYLFNGNEALDIARKFNYFAKIIQYLNAFGNGYAAWITSCYDTKHEEYMVQIQNTREETQLFVFSQKNQAWNGRYSYRYDQYLSFDNKTYGMGRWIDGDEAGTYLLDTGDSINNNVVQAKVWQSSAKNQILAKEFQGIRVSSSQVPTRVNVFDNVQQAEAGTIQCFINGADLRNYGSAFEQYIGRRIITGNDNRMQGTAIVYEITFGGSGDFKIVSSGIYWKPLV